MLDIRARSENARKVPGNSQAKVEKLLKTDTQEI